jgi:hypothetical protein
MFTCSLSHITRTRIRYLFKNTLNKISKKKTKSPRKNGSKLFETLESVNQTRMRNMNCKEIDRARSSYCDYRRVSFFSADKAYVSQNKR